MSNKMRKKAVTVVQGSRKNYACIYCLRKFRKHSVARLENLTGDHDDKPRKLWICADCLRQRLERIKEQVEEYYKKERERGVIHAYRD